MVIDGVASKQRFASLGQPIFSPDSRHLAYTAEHGGVGVVVDEAEPWGSYSWTSLPFWSPDGKRVGIEAALPNGRQCVVVNGTQGQAYRNVFEAQFTPDGRLFYWGVNVDRDACLVIDGQDAQKYPGYAKESLAVSGDGKHIAYAALKRVRPKPSWMHWRRIPPGNFPRSRMRMFSTPHLWSSTAAARPAGPPPMMMTSLSIMARPSHPELSPGL